jgi:hypothetical protein
MNLSYLKKRTWILIFNFLVLILIMGLLVLSQRESFTNYPQQVDPTATIKTNSDAVTANNNYAALLLYIQNNPSDSIKFIQDIQQKFFDSNCALKTNIDFSKIAQMPNGMPFSG